MILRQIIFPYKVYQTAMVLQFVWTLSRFCGVCLAFSLAVKKEDNCAEIHADFLWVESPTQVSYLARAAD